MIAGLAATAATAVVAMALIELGSRRWLRRHTRYYVWPPGLRLELHQAPTVFPGVESFVRFHVNTDGERGNDVQDRGEGLYRVLLAGGSPVECLALDQTTSWSGVLERLLNAPENLETLGAGQAHVGSIGRGGLSSEHLDLIFRHVIPQYRRLSAIVVMIGGNDVFLWLEDGAPTPLPVSSVGVAGTFSRHPDQRFGWSPKHWGMREVARRLRTRWFHPVERRADAGAWVARARRMRADAREVRTSVPDPAPMVDRFERHFRRLLQRAQAHADRVLVVRQPWFEKDYSPEESACLWHGGLGKAWKQSIDVYYAQDVLNRLMALVDARAAAVSDELGIEHLDLRPVLRPSLDNYYDYVHYTPAGADVVARAVADALLGRPEGAPDSSRPAAVSRSVTAPAASPSRPLRALA